MIGIIGAMEQEIEIIKQQIKHLNVIEKNTRTFYQGTIHNKGVVLVQAGIGKTNAAITTTLLIEYFNVDAIINIGVAGGQNGVHHKDVVVSTSALYHDVDITDTLGTYLPGQMAGEPAEFIADANLVTLSEEVLKESKIPYKIGRIATGDQFVYSTAKLDKVNAIYDNIFAVEMEAGAIAHTAHNFQVPFVIFRSISDVLDDDTQETDFYEFLEGAVQTASKLLLQLLDKME